MSERLALHDPEEIAALAQAVIDYERSTTNYKYEAIRQYYTTANAPDGSVLEFLRNYERGQPKRDRRGDAITDGFSAWGHDDFNIAVWEGDRLVSWDWMDESIEDHSADLAELAAELDVVEVTL